MGCTPRKDGRLEEKQRGRTASEKIEICGRQREYRQHDKETERQIDGEREKERERQEKGRSKGRKKKRGSPSDAGKIRKDHEVA